MQRPRGQDGFYKPERILRRYTGLSDIPFPESFKMVVRITKSSKKRKPRDARWTEILEVSTKIFSEKGYSSTTTSEIAEKLGIKKASLYYYINTKEDILFAILKEFSDEGLSEAKKCASIEGTALEKLHNVMCGHVERVGEYVTASNLYLNDFKSLSKENKGRISGGDDSVDAIFRELVEMCQKEGSIRKGLDADLSAKIILSSLNSTARWLQGNSKAKVKRIAANYADILLYGLTPK